MDSLIRRLSRLLRHRWCDEADLHRVLHRDALARVEAAVAASERHHAGQIRVVVEPGLPLSYLWRGLSARARAIMLFGKLRVWDTEHNCGVLVYLLLADRAIEIVADRGLSTRVDPSQWARIVEGMRPDLRQGRFEPGLLQAVAAVDGLLREHFPLAAGESPRNEMPDAPVIL
jgi:uncharacterized membrane protein